MLLIALKEAILEWSLHCLRTNHGISSNFLEAITIKVRAPSEIGTFLFIRNEEINRNDYFIMLIVHFDFFISVVQCISNAK